MKHFKKIISRYFVVFLNRSSRMSDLITLSDVLLLSRLTRNGITTVDNRDCCWARVKFCTVLPTVVSTPIINYDCCSLA